MAKRRFYVQMETGCEHCDAQGLIKDPTGLWARIDAVKGLRTDARSLERFFQENRERGSFTATNPPPAEEVCTACGGRGWLPGERVPLADALEALGVVRKDSAHG